MKKVTIFIRYVTQVSPNKSIIRRMTYYYVIVVCVLANKNCGTEFFHKTSLYSKSH